MIVMSRQRDESIMIGDAIEVVIVDIRGDKTRLGITSPKNIPVHRREIYDAIQREKGEVEKRPFKNKDLVWLVNETNQLVAKNPSIINSDYERDDKILYNDYMREIGKKKVY